MAVHVNKLLHSERGPSAAHRWRPCPGSVKLCRDLPDAAGIEAALGTVFHDYAADCVELGVEPQGFVGDTMVVEGHGRLTFDQQMADSMLNGLDIVWALADVPGAKMIVEKRVSLEDWVGENEFGTADIAIIDPLNWRLVVFDWKYGQGVPVQPEWNDQAILYALGVWSTFAEDMFTDHFAATNGEHAAWKGALEALEVIIIIEQPRAPGGGGTWTTDMATLLREGKKIKRDAAYTEMDDAPIVPGEKQCQFCAAAKLNVCKPRAQYLLDMAGIDFDELEDGFVSGAEIALPKALTPEQRSQVLLHKGQITKYLDGLHAEAIHDAEHGRPTPGLKRVEGRNPPRKWKDDKQAEILLEHDFKDKAFTKKLLSPAQAEEKAGKKNFKLRFARHVDTGEAKPILVPETDKRDPLPDYVSDFDALETFDDDNLV